MPDVRYDWESGSRLVQMRSIWTNDHRGWSEPGGRYDTKKSLSVLDVMDVTREVAAV